MALFAAEQARIIQLLVQRVTATAAGFDANIRREGIAEPAMILSPSIDDMGHGLIGQAVHNIMQHACSGPSTARIDQHRALRCFDQTERGVVAKVLRIALFGGAFDGPDARGDGPDSQDVSEGGDRQDKRSQGKKTCFMGNSQ